MFESMDVVVIGTNKLLRAGIVSLLKPCAKSVSEASDAIELQALMRDGAQYGVALLEMPLGGQASIAQFRELLPRCRLAILSDQWDAAMLSACFAIGVDGFLLKDISPDTLVESLKLLALGEKVFPSSLAGMISGTSSFTEEGARPFAGLSERELDILHCLIDGDSNKKIANRLCITEATVKVHLKSILRKTHVANRTQAAIWALQSGLRKRKLPAGEVFPTNGRISRLAS